MQTVINNMQTIEKVVSMMVTSREAIPPANQNHGDCLAACLLAMELGLNPYSAMTKISSHTQKSENPSISAEVVVDALLGAKDEESLIGAEALLNSFVAHDDLANVLIKVHQYKRRELARFLSAG